MVLGYLPSRAADTQDTDQSGATCGASAQLQGAQADLKGVERGRHGRMTWTMADRETRSSLVPPDPTAPAAAVSQGTGAT